MQQEMERRQTELSTAQGTIRSLHNLSTSVRVPSIKSLEIFPGYEIFACRKLEEQLKETQVAKDELVAQQQELHEMMIRLDKD